MTKNPSKDFERWGEAQGSDLEADIRELAALPGYEVVYVVEASQSLPESERRVADRVESFDVVLNGIPAEFKVGYIKVDETS